MIKDKPSNGLILNKEMVGNDSVINTNKALERYIIELTYNNVTSVEQVSNDIPENFNLLQNYPNPFKPTTTISFDLPFRSFVVLNIYNSIGEFVDRLIDGEFDAGSYNASWNASGLTSGIYFYELKTDKFNSVRKMLLVK